MTKRTAGHLVAISIVLWGCISKEREPFYEKVAANQEVKEYMKTFKGRGVLSDGSDPTPALQAVDSFRVVSDLSCDLVLHEPEVQQPVFINFDHRGRLWIVQYNQYPYPKGLKVVELDQYLRAKFDKEPVAPPDGEKGEDKITFFEDTDNDGKYDKSTDAITGLNIATSVALGRGRIWVLNPPYLLAYPDVNDDGIPDGDPVVHLSGFGLEDTHAVANSLRWGPDGWLYGAQGSTCTANISSSVTKNVRFSGQAIWRYHPLTHIFEIFAEGGGNAFSIEIDSKGRIYSGHNGNETRGQYYKQGGYFLKGFTKHGAHTNPYALGFLPGMELEGDKVRFTHAFIKYEETLLPSRYRGEMIAVNPLRNYLQLSSFEHNGSTFKNSDKEHILETNDRWFRPVDIKTGPDGAVYIADWYDNRLTHIDPRDNWHKKSGRIYRLSNKSGKERSTKVDMSVYTNDQLVDALSNPNKWFRQEALRLIGDRGDSSFLPRLLPLLDSDNVQTALEGLWAIHLCGGFSEEIALRTLAHKDPFVRMWAIRLLGDERKVSFVISRRLADLAVSETHPEVRSQLASTARRLPGADAIPIVKNMLLNDRDANDPHIPLLLWWAIESKASTDREAVVALFNDRQLWNRKIVSETILQRLMYRYIQEGGTENISACSRLLSAAPSMKAGKPLLQGLKEGLRGGDASEISPELAKALKPYGEVIKDISISVGIRQGDEKAIEEALAFIMDKEANLDLKLSYISIMGEVRLPSCKPVLLRLIGDKQASPKIGRAALQALQRYDDADIGSAVLEMYPDLRRISDLTHSAFALFSSRPVWAVQFLKFVEQEKGITKSEIPSYVIDQLRMLGDPQVNEILGRLWPETYANPDKTEQLKRITKLVRSGAGEPEAGSHIFQAMCGSCHRLFDKGGNIGPDLTGYDRNNLGDMLTNIIDPDVYIREGYGLYRIVTKDGGTIIGSIAGQSGENYTVLPQNGKPVIISGKDIKVMDQLKKSLMPTGLLDNLTDQQIRDMFSYLMMDKK